MDQACVVFLQNAWSPVYAGHVWPRPSWLRALARSKTGQRLRLMIDDLDCCEETTPVVTPTPSGVAPPDPRHIKAVLERRDPEIIVACGKQAEQALTALWFGPMLVVPHPAHRLVTNELYREARRMIAEGLRGRCALRQQRGGFECLPIKGTLLR